VLNIRKLSPTAYFVAILVIVALAIFMLPISVPTSIEAVGRITPSREWYLLHDRSGRIMAMVNDRLGNTTTSLLVQQFERQDAVRFDLNPAIRLRGTVDCGDTIGVLSSSEAELQLAQLEGEYSTADAKVLVYETGEKSAIVQEAQKRIEYATRRYEGHLRTLERMKTLMQKGVVSPQEYEDVETANSLYKAEIDVAKAQLRSAETGAKPAEQKLGRSDRSSLLGQIHALKRKMDRGILTAPFSGTVLHSSLSDTLFYFGDTRSLAVVFSVPWSDRRHIHEGQNVTLRASALAKDLTASIRSIGNIVHSIRGEQVVLITGVVETSGVDLLPGVVMRCSIPCSPVPLRKYLLSYLGGVFSR
jgi:hypothetical protein